MEEYWNIKIIRNHAEYFRYQKYLNYKIVESLWHMYLTEYLDYPSTTFTEYLLKEWSIIMRGEVIQERIKTWFEIKNRILQ